MSEAQELQKRSSRPRLYQLDALRGLAAVTVIVQHLHSAYSTTRTNWFFVFFGSGSAAVVLFFVLSGYVLSLPSWDGRMSPYSIYVVRRFCRIYLPFAAAATLSILGDLYFRRFHLPLTPWFAQTWQSPLHLRLVLLQFTMWPMPQFNTAFWSLFFEMEMSLVLPFLCLALKRWNAVVLTLAAYVAVYGGTGLVHHMGTDLSQHHLWANGLRTLQVMCHFLLGATLSRYAVQLSELWARIGQWQWLVLIGSLACYWDLLMEYRLPPLHLLTAAIAHIPLYSNLMEALGAAGIILSSLHLAPLARVLRHAVPEYLGRISYSVYLMHGLVLFAALDLLSGRLGKPALFGIVVVGSLALGHAFCVAVEEPSMRLGKRLADYLRVKQGRPRSLPDQEQLIPHMAEEPVLHH